MRVELRCTAHGMLGSDKAQSLTSFPGKARCTVLRHPVGGPPPMLNQSVPYGHAGQVGRSAPHWQGRPPVA
eukprot:5735315-Amphidinium_carterae.2